MLYQVVCNLQDTSKHQLHLDMVLPNQEFLHPFLKGENGIFSRQVIEQPLECSKD